MDGIEMTAHGVGGRMPPVVPKPPSLAERVFRSLRDEHRHLALRARADGNEAETLSALYVHLPSGEAIRAKTIAVAGSLLKFVTEEGVTALVAPESVAVTLTPISPDSWEEQFPIGFHTPSQRDEGGDEEPLSTPRE